VAIGGQKVLIVDEDGWLTSIEPTPMLDYLRGKKVSERKLRLYAVACCRRIWDFLTDERCRKAVEMAERYADGSATENELHDARAGAHAARTFAHASTPFYPDLYSAAEAASDAAYAVSAKAVAEAPIPSDAALGAAGHAANAVAANEIAIAEADFDAKADPDGELFVDTGIPEAIWNRSRTAEGAMQADLLRDILFNPFKPVTIETSWLTPNVIALAQNIYNQRAFDRMPILGNALEEAGCDNTDILIHCRSQTEHVRGCWVVDATLGKS
jgi:hypothetical protein